MDWPHYRLLLCLSSARWWRVGKGTKCSGGMYVRPTFLSANTHTHQKKSINVLFTGIRRPVIANLFDRQPDNDGISLLPQRLNTCVFDSPRLYHTSPSLLFPLPWPPATLPGETVPPCWLQTRLKRDPGLRSKYRKPANLSKVWGYRWREQGWCTICSLMSWQRMGTGWGRGRGKREGEKKEEKKGGKRARCPIWPLLTPASSLSSEDQHQALSLSLSFFSSVQWIGVRERRHH